MTARLYLTAFFLLLISSTASAKLDKETSAQISIVLDRAVTSGDHATRAAALEALTAYKPSEGRALALKALKEPVWAVRKVAIQVLMHARNNDWKEALSLEMMNPRRNLGAEIMPMLAGVSDKVAAAVGHRVLRDEKATTKNEVIAAFSKTSGGRMTAFFKPLLTDKDEALATGIRRVVLTLRRADALPLFSVMVSKGNAETKKAALDALREFPKGAKVTFARSLLRSADTDIRSKAAAALAFHGDKSAIPLLLPELESGDETRIVRALESLVEVASAREYGALRSLYSGRETSAKVRGLIMEIHYRNGDPGLSEAVKRFRKLDDIDTQAIAVYYMGLVEKGRVLNDLHRDMTHGNEKVRIAAIRAVGRIGSRDSISHLSQAMDNAQSSEARIAVAEAVAQIQDKDVVPVVTFWISDRNAEVRKWAIVALTRVQHKDAVPSLRIAMTDRDLGARAQAVEAILRLDKTAGLGAFRTALPWISVERLQHLASVLKGEFSPYVDMMLTSPRTEVWQLALAMLQNDRGREVTLITAALDRTRNVNLKIAILTRLVARNANATVDRLTKLSGSANSLVLRTAALELLGRTRAKKVSPLLKEALYDQEERVRLSAAVALLRLNRKLR
jgi:HEAT repeat protein